MKNTPLFSIIIVCLNPGESLTETFESVKKQTFCDYEVVIKDGLSKDGSVETLLKREKELAESATTPYLKVISKKDKSIYDAMNQALCEVKGEYVLFLNCGDSLYDENVLKQVAESIKQTPDCGIYYGDTFYEKTGNLIAAPQEITGFTCYRNIPCHQACFYHSSLFDEKRFETDYRIRADYDHFLWCYYRGNAKPYYIGVTISSYEGGGYSESKENKERDRQEHRLITKEYMSAGELAKYKAIMAVTLAPVRRAMAESKVLSGVYQGVKRVVYGKKG